MLHDSAVNKPQTITILRQMYESALQMVRLQAGQPAEKQWRKIAEKRRQALEDAGANV